MKYLSTVILMSAIFCFTSVFATAPNKQLKISYANWIAKYKTGPNKGNFTGMAVLFEHKCNTSGSVKTIPPRIKNDTANKQILVIYSSSATQSINSMCKLYFRLTLPLQKGGVAYYGFARQVAFLESNMQTLPITLNCSATQVSLINKSNTSGGLFGNSSFGSGLGVKGSTLDSCQKEFNTFNCKAKAFYNDESGANCEPQQSSF